MAEEMLSYSTCNMQDWSMLCRFEVHTSGIGLHSVEALHVSPSDVNIVTFDRSVR
jgi:hypothetical protein